MYRLNHCWRIDMAKAKATMSLHLMLEIGILQLKPTGGMDQRLPSCVHVQNP